MKAVLQLLGAMLAAVVPLVTVANDLTLTEWINVAVVAAGAATVWLTANAPDGVWSYTKTFMSLVSAGGVVLISALGDGSISAVEWMQIGTAVVAAIQRTEAARQEAKTAEQIQAAAANFPGGIAAYQQFQQQQAVNDAIRSGNVKVLPVPQGSPIILPGG